MCFMTAERVGRRVMPAGVQWTRPWPEGIETVKIRKIVFWSHLGVGLAAGLVVLTLAVTGVLLTYEVQITRWAETRVAVDVSGARLSANDLAEAARRETGGRATALVFENAETAPVTVTMGREGKILLDPFSGAVVGQGGLGAGRFFDAVTHFHRWLSPAGFSGPGRAVTGAANLGFLFLLVTGAYLWLPRIWKWAKLKTLILFRRDYPNGQVRDFHWHHIFAFWSVIPLVFIIGTGVTLSYDRAQGLVMTLVGVGAEDGDPPQGEGAARDGGAGDAPLRSGAGGAGLEAILAAAMAHDPAWERVTLNLPMTPEAEEATAVVDTGPGRRMTFQETLTISLADAAVVSVKGFSEEPRAVRTFMFLRFAHTGEHFGLVGQTIAGLASLATVFMVYTGLALAYRRLVRPVLRRLRRPRGA